MRVQGQQVYGIRWQVWPGIELENGEGGVWWGLLEGPRPGSMTSWLGILPNAKPSGIFTQYMWEKPLFDTEPFTILTDPVFFGRRDGGWCIRGCQAKKK